MSIATMVVGESGSGKTTSLRGLDPAKTLLIQALKKPLPFRGRGWGYLSKSNRSGNMLVSDQPVAIIDAMRRTQREIVVIDDWQYTMSNEFMRRSSETGYQKFTEIGRGAWEILNAAGSLADRKRVYLLTHSATDEMGHTRAKTIGRMLDEKIVIEGMLTIVLRTCVRDGTYQFTTQTNGNDTTKSPIGLFADGVIENDLAAVDAAICAYYEISPLPQAA